MKRKKVGLLIGIVGLLLIVGALLYYFISGNESKKEQNIEVSGVYKQGDTYIKLYELDLNSDKEKTNVSYNINGYLFGQALLENNKLITELEDLKLEIIVDSEEITLKVDDSSKEEYKNTLKNGVYKKSKGYNMEEYYKDNYGDPSYLKTKYNGVFKNNNITLTMFQMSNNQVSVFFTGHESNNPLENYYMYDLLEDGTLKELPLIFEEITTTINIEDNSVTFESTKIEDLSNTYTKISDVTMKDIITR